MMKILHQHHRLSCFKLLVRERREKNERKSKNKMQNNSRVHRECFYFGKSQELGQVYHASFECCCFSFILTLYLANNPNSSTHTATAHSICTVRERRKNTKKNLKISFSLACNESIVDGLQPQIEVSFNRVKLLKYLSN